MSKDQQLIVDYPEDFPISGPLRAVFTERLKTFFEGCNTWSCSSEGSLPEKLLKMRKEMQESIGYPPSLTAASVARMQAGLQPDPGNCHESDIQVDSWGAVSATKKVVMPEELFSWKGLQAKSIKELSPIVRNAGLEMASRILGLQIRYGEADASDGQPDGVTMVSDQDPEPGCTGLSVDGLHPAKGLPAQLCPFSWPKRIGVLTKNWSYEDREKLIHVIKRHVGIAATIALIAGMVLGGVLTPSGTVVITPPGYHHEAYAERQYDAPHAVASIPQPILSQPAGPVLQPSRSALVVQPAKGASVP